MKQSDIDDTNEKRLVGEMVLIPGGTFMMGDTNGDGFETEQPAHEVNVAAFRMARHEVTVGQFRQFVDATGYRTEAEKHTGCFTYIGDNWESTPDGSWHNLGYSVGDEHPVVCVTWNDAQAFIEWLTEQTGNSFRLPSEAEWEYAARAGSASKYHFGNDEVKLCRYANHLDNSTESDLRNRYCSDGIVKRASAVGRYLPNKFGLYDMHGNVFEWTADRWHINYEEAPNDGCVWEGGCCDTRVIRGGSWNDGPKLLRSAFRYWLHPSSVGPALGFRLAQDL